MTKVMMVKTKQPLGRYYLICQLVLNCSLGYLNHGMHWKTKDWILEWKLKVQTIIRAIYKVQVQFLVHTFKIISLRIWCGNWINNKTVKLWLFTSNVCSESAIELFKAIESSAKKFEIAQKQAVIQQEKFQIRESTEDESKFYDLTTIYTSINGNVAKKNLTSLIYGRRIYI